MSTIEMQENEMDSQHSNRGSLFEQGLAVRREVLGREYVDASLAKADDFMMAFQEVVTEWCWGKVWTRPGLSRKTRSLLNLSMLTALNRGPEVRLHTLGALRNGCTVEEIKEALLQATIYCGIPAGLDSFKIAAEVIKKWQAGEYPQDQAPASGVAA